MNGSSIEMKNNSTIKGFYYAINVTALNDNLSISIVDSKIDSWAALNIWSSNNKFKIIQHWSLITINLKDQMILLRLY